MCVFKRLEVVHRGIKYFVYIYSEIDTILKLKIVDVLIINELKSLSHGTFNLTPTKGGKFAFQIHKK